MNENTTFEQFRKTCKAVRLDRRVQVTAQFSHTKSFGCVYYVYVCLMTFETFNPFAKKNEGREYKCFQSSAFADDSKKQAFEYIRRQVINQAD